MFSQKKSDIPFDRINSIGNTETSPELVKLTEQHPIAFFCTEYSIDDSLPIYAGGLGILAGDIFLEASSQGVNLVSIGLLYSLGFPSYPRNEVGQADPIKAGFIALQKNDGGSFLIKIKISSREIFAKVWKKEFGSASLYLLDCNIEENNEEDRGITNHLYPDSFDKRLIQQLVLGIGGIKLLEELNISPSIYHLNEGHTCFTILALALNSVKKNKIGLAEAIESVKPLIVGTKHTILAGAGIFFTKDQCKKYLESYLEEYSVNFDDFFNLGVEDAKLEIFSTTRFLLRSVNRSNAVSEIHSRFEKETYPECKNIIAITNGVNKTRWMLPDLMSPAQISGETLWKVHLEAKEKLIKYASSITNHDLNSEALVIVWARRIASYKQPLLIFNDLKRLSSILADTKNPVYIFISGKAYIGDNEGIEILEQIKLRIKELNSDRIFYFPNYSASLTSILSQGADIWLNTPIIGKEASGTSGMKAALNGAIQLSTKDGWIEEEKLKDSVWCLDEKNQSDSLYDILEKEIIPTFFNRKDGMPPVWIEKMKTTREIVLKNYTSSRMFNEYMERLYFPLVPGK